MTNTILASIDLAHPKDQQRVLKRARQMADMDNARLAVVTVLPDYKMSMVSTFFSDDHSRNMLEETRQAQHKFVQTTIGKDEAVKHVVRMGSIYEEVLLTADELQCSLIVVGAHKPNYSDYLIGPNAARISRHATCSVYVVR